MALYDTNKNLIAGSRKTNIYRCNSFAEYEALPEAEKAKYDYVATPDNAVKYFIISNSDANVGEPFYTNKTNSFEVFKIVADTIFNDIDASRELTPYVGHATAYTTDDSGYPNFSVTTWVASACMGASGHPYIRIRIFSDGGGEYIFRRSQDGTYALAPVSSTVMRGNFNIEYTSLAVEVPTTITFSKAMPNANYVINIEPLGVNTSWRISGKTVNGFTITGIKNSGSTGIVQYGYTAFTVD